MFTLNTTLNHFSVSLTEEQFALLRFNFVPPNHFKSVAQSSFANFKNPWIPSFELTNLSFSKHICEEHPLSRQHILT